MTKEMVRNTMGDIIPTKGKKYPLTEYDIRYIRIVLKPSGYAQETTLTGVPRKENGWDHYEHSPTIPNYIEPV